MRAKLFYEMSSFEQKETLDSAIRAFLKPLTRQIRNQDTQVFEKIFGDEMRKVKNATKAEVVNAVNGALTQMYSLRRIDSPDAVRAMLKEQLSVKRGQPLEKLYST